MRRPPRLRRLRRGIAAFWAALWAALTASEIEVGHFRDGQGAAFVAIEAHFGTGAPVIAFTTTGPGVTNAITGLLAAWGESAKVSVVSACASIQELAARLGAR